MRALFHSRLGPWLAFPLALVLLLPGWRPLPDQARVVSTPVPRPPAIGPAGKPIAAAAKRAVQAVDGAIRAYNAQQVRAAAHLHNDFQLHTEGSQVLTAWNAPVTLKAINWYGFEYAPFVPDGLNRVPLDTILSTLQRLGFNALRLTFADQTVEQNPVVTQGVNANPDLRGLHALDIMQRVIERAHRFGLRVILCNSRSEAGRGPETQTGLWYTTRYTAQDWMNDWVTLARRFRNDSAFVGADLRNEPHMTNGVFTEQSYFQNGPLWGAYHGTYYHDRDWHYVAETLGNRLLAVNPHLLIIVEGVQIYLDPDNNVLYGGLWGSNLEGVQYDPVVLSRPGQLVYSVHEYGPQMWQGNWFNPGTTYAKLARRWNRFWGYLLSARRTLRAPIFVGEFGTCHEYRSCIVDPLGWKQGFWFQAFVHFMSVHPEVGWAYWALNPDGPFQSNQVNYYSLASLDWKHYYPLVVHGLAPLLREPDGLWTHPARATPLTPMPGCSPALSCARTVTQSLARKSIAGPSGTAPSGPPAAGPVAVRANVPYVRGGGPQQRGDLYLPRASTHRPRPALLIVHGGTWEQGGRGPASAALARTLAGHGYVVYDIDVRLAEFGGAFPRDIRDVKAGATFLRMHAARLGVDPWKIGAVGADAGGYLAAMAAYTPDTGIFGSPLYNPNPGRIAAVASLWAPADLAREAHDGVDSATAAGLQGYLGTTYAANPDLYGLASPTSYVTGGVATIFFHGLSDEQAPFRQTFRLFRYLKQRSVPAELVDVPGAPHGLGFVQSALGAQVLRQMEAFFDGVFYQPPAPAS